MLSSQIPNDPGLKVILPRIVYSDPSTPVGARPVPVARMGGVTAPLRLGQHPHVEDHVAMLVFKTANLDQRASHWGAVKQLPGTTDYSYVQLNGERVQFDLGHRVLAGALGNVILPKLPALCHKPALPLKPGYLPATNYRDAAAVLDVSGGVVNSCLSSQTRIDSEISLSANGVLLVFSGVGANRKELLFRPTRWSSSLELIVANVPANCLSGQCVPPDLSAMNGMTHVHAYYDMVTGDTSGCNMSITAWFHSLSQRPSACSMTNIPGAAGGLGALGNGIPGGAGSGGYAAKGPGGTGDETLVYNFECSNSQWP